MYRLIFVFLGLTCFVQAQSVITRPALFAKIFEESKVDLIPCDVVSVHPMLCGTSKVNPETLIVDLAVSTQKNALLAKETFQYERFLTTKKDENLFFGLNQKRHWFEVSRTTRAGIASKDLTFVYLTEFTGDFTVLIAPELPVGQSGNLYDLEVLRYLCQPSSNGYARVFGSIRNTSSRNFKFLEFSVEFFNGSQFVGQESSYVKADDLAPNAETTFETIAKVGSYTRCALSFEDKAGKLKVRLP